MSDAFFQQFLEAPPPEASRVDEWIAKFALAALKSGLASGESWRLPSIRIREAIRIEEAYRALPASWSKLKNAAEGQGQIDREDFHSLLEQLPSPNQGPLSPSLIGEIEALLHSQPTLRSSDEDRFDRLADSIEDELDAPGALENLRGLYKEELEKRKSLEELLRRLSGSLGDAGGTNDGDGEQESGRGEDA